MRSPTSLPQIGERFLCRHPFSETKRVFVTPSGVEPLLTVVWDGPGGGLPAPLPTIEMGRSLVKSQLAAMREDHLRHMNPTPYKVSVSSELYAYLHKLWAEEAPIGELS